MLSLKVGLGVSSIKERFYLGKVELGLWITPLPFPPNNIAMIFEIQICCYYFILNSGL
jgi:hypothetical protein